MQKNIFEKSKIPCSECGSENTVITKKPLSMVSKLEKFLGIHKVNPPFRGRVFVCCKDCKAEIALQVM